MAPNFHLWRDASYLEICYPLSPFLPRLGYGSVGNRSDPIKDAVNYMSRNGGDPQSHRVSLKEINKRVVRAGMRARARARDGPFAYLPAINR